MEEISASVVYDLLQQVETRNEDRHKTLRASIDALNGQIVQLVTAQAAIALAQNGRLVAIETRLATRREFSNRQVALTIPAVATGLVIVWESLKHFLGWK